MKNGSQASGPIPSLCRTGVVTPHPRAGGAAEAITSPNDIHEDRLLLSIRDAELPSFLESLLRFFSTPRSQFPTSNFELAGRAS